MQPRIPWRRLREGFEAEIRRSFGDWIDPRSPRFGSNLAFAVSRLEEGRRISSLLLERIARRPIRVIDIGAGNGGVALALANRPEFRVVALDVVPNPDLVAQRERSGLPVLQLVADGRRLPLKASSVDAVLALETLEHVARPAELAAEIMRALHPDGLAMATTPARLRHLLGRDPHFGVPGLLLLPDSLQRLIVTRFTHRSEFTGEGAHEYDVEHIYWSARTIARMFPGPKRVEVMRDESSADPAGWRNRIGRLLPNYLWTRILITPDRDSRHRTPGARG